MHAGIRWYVGFLIKVTILFHTTTPFLEVFEQYNQFSSQNGQVHLDIQQQLFKMRNASTTLLRRHNANFKVLRAVSLTKSKYGLFLFVGLYITAKNMMVILTQNVVMSVIHSFHVYSF